MFSPQMLIELTLSGSTGFGWACNRLLPHLLTCPSCFIRLAVEREVWIGFLDRLISIQLKTEPFATTSIILTNELSNGFALAAARFKTGQLDKRPTLEWNLRQTSFAFLTL